MKCPTLGERIAKAADMADTKAKAKRKHREAIGKTLASPVEIRADRIATTLSTMLAVGAISPREIFSLMDNMLLDYTDELRSIGKI